MHHDNRSPPRVLIGVEPPAVLSLNICSHWREKINIRLISNPRPPQVALPRLSRET